MTSRCRTERRLVSVAAAVVSLAMAPTAFAAETRPTAGVERRWDLPYAGDVNPRRRLDLYLPESPSRAVLPVVIYLHSGGWISGDKSEGARFLEPLVATGRFAGVSAGYRLADEALWPAQLHDAQAAVRWVRANAPRYGFDEARIAVGGWSAGGHLALMLGTTADVAELDGALGPHRSASLRVTAVVNLAGITDLLAVAGAGVSPARRGPRSFESRLLGGLPRERPESALQASPVSHVSPGDAPVLTVHGTADRTVPYDQAVRLHRGLHGAGVASTLVTRIGAGHVDLLGTSSDRIRAFLETALEAPGGGGGTGLAP